MRILFQPNLIIMSRPLLATIPLRLYIVLFVSVFSLAFFFYISLSVCLSDSFYISFSISLSVSLSIKSGLIPHLFKWFIFYYSIMLYFLVSYVSSVSLSLSVSLTFYLSTLSSIHVVFLRNRLYPSSLCPHSPLSLSLFTFPQ